MQLPPQLCKLDLGKGCAHAAALAALLPAPPSLECVRLFGLTLQPRREGAEHAADELRLHPAAASHVAGAVALLAGRLQLPRGVHRRARALLAVRVMAWDDDCLKLAAAGLSGPHAVWLRHLAPLGGTVVCLTLKNLQLSAGDLAALAAAMPCLQVCGHAQGAGGA